jgi:hypothetical protein
MRPILSFHHSLRLCNEAKCLGLMCVCRPKITKKYILFSIFIRVVMLFQFELKENYKPSEHIWWKVEQTRLAISFLLLTFSISSQYWKQFSFTSVQHQIQRIYEYIKLDSWLNTLSVTWIDSLNRLKIRAMFTILILYLLLMPNSSFNLPKRLICSSILGYEPYQNPICRINNY